jgi:chromosome segregation protein
MLRKFTDNTQMVIITHNTRTMAAAESLYGVTMRDRGISSLVSIKLVEEGKVVSESKVA